MRKGKDNLEEYYTVQKILDVRMRGRCKWYLVQWQNYDITQASWEPLSNLSYSKEMLKEFEKNRKAQVQTPKNLSSPQKRVEVKQEPISKNFTFTQRRDQQNRQDSIKRQRTEKANDEFEKIGNEVQGKKKRFFEPKNNSSKSRQRVSIMTPFTKEAQPKRQRRSYSRKNRKENQQMPQKKIGDKIPKEKEKQIIATNLTKQNSSKIDTTPTKNEQEFHKTIIPNRFPSENATNQWKTNAPSSVISETNVSLPKFTSNQINKPLPIGYMKKTSKKQQKKISKTQEELPKIVEESKSDNSLQPFLPITPSKNQEEEQAPPLKQLDSPQKSLSNKMYQCKIVQYHESLVQLPSQVKKIEASFPSVTSFFKPQSMCDIKQQQLEPGDINPPNKLQVKTKTEDAFGVPQGIKYVKFQNGHCQYSVKYSSGCRIIMSSEIAQQVCLPLLLKYLEERNSDRLRK